jgi:hypothetical protein
MHVSNSEISSFRRCRRRWWLGNYRKLRKIDQRVTGPLPLGSRIHEALAVKYAPVPGDPIAKIREQYETARNQLDPEDATARDELNKEADLALIMIEGYVQWVEDTGVDDDIEVLAVEKELIADFEGLRVPVQIIGKLDTRVRRITDDRLFSMDHKTCASFDGLTKTLEINEQPLMYQLLERLTLPVDQHVTGGMLNMLRKVKRTAAAKPPFYLREPIHHTDVGLRSYWYRILGVLSDMIDVVDALDNGVDPRIAAYPNPTKDCAWDCEFRVVCPMFDDGSYAEGVIESSYMIHNPLERYSSEAEVNL